MDTNTSISLHEFAWHSLTGQQQYRIKVKYEIVKRLKDKSINVTKRDIYRVIADEFGYTMQRIEDVAKQIK